jgi:uncharacterized protein (DUF1800 family)
VTSDRETTAPEGLEESHAETVTWTPADESAALLPVVKASLAIAAAGSLAACGGGGGGGGSGGGSPPPPPPPPVPLATEAEAAHFLLQAQFSAPDNDITAVRNQGFAAWLNAQFAGTQGQRGIAWLDSQSYNAITSDERYFWPQFGDFMIWNQLLTAPDQMRKRCALALSEMFVVSLSPIDGFYPPYMIGAYWDVLVNNAFGNFRALLEQITLNAAMGFFLNTKGNLKEDAASGRQPDENYAREIMQLFTIGLYELNADGTLRTDSGGRPIETYGQNDITNLARVFTGYDHDFTGSTYTPVSWVNYSIPSTHFTTNPMRLTPSNHSNLAVSFLGTSIPANTPGADALRIALDALFNHANTGPFFAKQMIQRLVTSNPSPAYVGRVAAAFANNGSGVRGDLRAVWRAILTDPEARAEPDASNTMSGKLREPIVRLVQWARTVGFTGTAFEIYDLSGSDIALGQSPLRSPSVFNFFRPGYIPPHTVLADNDRLAPEFQLHNETTTAGTINFLQWMTRWGYNDVVPTYAAVLPIAHNVPATVAWFNLRLAGNQLSSDTISRIETALASLNVTQSSADADKLNLLSAACLLILSAPEYLIQK